MRLSDKMTQTRHNLDEVYENLGDGITSALNKMFEYGAEAERQRIIKLLESDLCGNGKPALSDDMDCEHDEQTKHLIALIKGEN